MYEKEYSMDSIVLLVGSHSGCACRNGADRKPLERRGVILLTIFPVVMFLLINIAHIVSTGFDSVSNQFISLCSALFNPTTMSVIPIVVGKSGLQRANALSQMVAGAVA
ncbi:hypothetical protein [Pelosinus baikalensis]|uniref:hypothetical protein n=1 Tax=Pelosinus baikalensis TaxID=2892015 RepID=UPI001E4C7023|nr:hypothetical protein [Pelosinus baikalensis]